MASVLRGSTVDPGRVRDVSQPLLLDPAWQALLDGAAERAHQDGLAAGRIEGGREAREAADRIVEALTAAVGEIRAEIQHTLRLSARDLTSEALDLVERLAGHLPVEPEVVQARVEDALAALDGERLRVHLPAGYVDRLRDVLGEDPRVEVVEDATLAAGEARITGEWSHAELRWGAVFEALREMLDA